MNRMLNLVDKMIDLAGKVLYTKVKRLDKRLDKRLSEKVISAK